MIPDVKPTVKKKRKTRTDKGVIRATNRDMACIAWIAEQYAARGDQIQVLLSWYPDKTHPMEGELVSQSTTREQIGRWARAGWVVYKRMLAQGPGWAYVTRAGLHLVGLDDIFKPHPPSEKMLSHIFAVNQVRLWMDEDEMYPDEDEDIAFYWKSERRFRAGLDLKRGESSGPIADGIVYPDGGDATAIEVQISSLKPAEWVNKFRELLRHRDEREDYRLRYSEIWVYVPTAEMEAAALAACAKLDADEKARIDVILQDDLLMEECSWF